MALFKNNKPPTKKPKGNPPVPPLSNFAPPMEESAGKKFDYGKSRYDLIAADALEAIVEVYTYGASKYADNNWRKGMRWGRVFGALMRHAWAFWRGEDYDEESGCHHMAMVAWQAITLINYCESHPELDDRVKDLRVQEKFQIPKIGDGKEN